MKTTHCDQRTDGSMSNLVPYLLLMGLGFLLRSVIPALGPKLRRHLGLSPDWTQFGFTSTQVKQLKEDHERINQVCAFLVQDNLWSRNGISGLEQSQAIVDWNKGFLHQLNPKVGTTTWIKIITQWNAWIHQRNAMKAELKSNLTLEEENRADLFKFIFVRHPWQRLVSAFYNKFFNSSQVDSDEGSQFKGLLSTLINATDQPDFRFQALNVHLLPQYVRGRFCHRHYDFIGRMETFVRDSQMVLRILEFPEPFIFDVLKRKLNCNSAESSNRSTCFKSEELRQQSYLRLVGTLDLETIQKIEAIYQNDFLMFGY